MGQFSIDTRQMKSILLTLVLTFTARAALGGMCDGGVSAVDNILEALIKHPNGGNRTSRLRNNNLPTDEIVRGRGYPAETHYATTEDGYILALHRIPHGRSNKDLVDRPVVLLQHGLICSSADWVIPMPSKGLAFILADAGYDVWMGNYRGNTYSRNHTSLNPDKSDGFWDFTWDEMAKYDLPAQIEKVLEVTGKSDLQYIGHSMGTTGFMAMHHYRTDIAQKIRLAHLLSPVAFVGHMESPIAWIASLGPYIDTIVGWFGIGEFLPSNLLIDCLASLFCHGFTEDICTNILFLLCGYDEPQMNKTLLDPIMHHDPAGASSYTVLHYIQKVVSDDFAGFDWGSEEKNIKHHGSKDFPKYNLGDVTTPVAVYYGQNDWLAAMQDVTRTIDGLPNIQEGMRHEVEYPTWNHLDFLWAIDADKYVYQPLLKNIAHCSQNECRI